MRKQKEPLINANEREPRKQKEIIRVYSRSFAVNSGHRLEDHFVDVTEVVEIGKEGQRPVE